jgi:hypothetical protein
MPPMREDLLALFDRAELKKYLTEEELPPEPAASESPAVSETTATEPEGNAS